MRTLTTATWSVLIAAAVGLVTGCAYTDEPVPDGSSGSTSTPTTETQEQGITVQTRFVLEGLDALGDDVRIDRLFLNVGAIFLEPTESDTASFASRYPFELDFDVERGEVVLAGPDMHLPFGGDFAMSVQVEPAIDIGGIEKVEEEEITVGIWGDFRRILGHESVMSDPTPLPWMPGCDEEGSDCDRSRGPSTDGRTLEDRVPFAFVSSNRLRIYVADVSLHEDGTYDLTLSLRVGEWLSDTLIPAIQEAEPSRFPLVREDDPFNVTRPDENEDTDLSGLIGGIGVSTDREE